MALRAQQRAGEDHGVNAGRAHGAAINVFFRLCAGRHGESDVIAQVRGLFDAAPQKFGEQQIAKHVALTGENHAERAGLPGCEAAGSSRGAVAVHFCRSAHAGAGIFRHFGETVEGAAHGGL